MVPGGSSYHSDGAAFKFKFKTLRGLDIRQDKQLNIKSWPQGSRLVTAQPRDQSVTMLKSADRNHS